MVGDGLKENKTVDWKVWSKSFREGIRLKEISGEEKKRYELIPVEQAWRHMLAK